MQRFYNDTWQAFLSRQTSFATSDYQWPVWHHQGRAAFCFWALLPDSAALEAQIQQAHQALAPFLLSDYHKQTHITVYAAGFLAQEKILADDVTQDCLNQQADCIRARLKKPFVISTGALNSFAGAPFIEVFAQPELIGLHQALSDAFGKDRDGELVPHITLGLYQKAYDCQMLAQVMQSVVIKPQQIACSSLYLMRYLSCDIRSPLEILQQLPLA